MNFLTANRIPVSTSSNLLNSIIDCEKPSSFSKQVTQHMPMNSPFPRHSVNRTVSLLQQMFSSLNLLGDFLWCSPDDRAAYIWYQCEVRSSRISPQKMNAYWGQRAPRKARMTASEARSQTISRTAPKLLHWLNFLAAIPSSASSISESPQRMMVARGRSRQVKMAATMNAYLRQPMMLGMNRNTLRVFNMYFILGSDCISNLIIISANLIQIINSLYFTLLRAYWLLDQSYGLQYITMLRLANLLRGKAIPKSMATRSGIPNWDRPDPPPSATVPYDHEITDEEMIFYFPDRNMPEFILSQPEVYEGDTLLEATPMLLKGFAVFLSMAGLIGFFSYLATPPKSYETPSKQMYQNYEQNKKLTEEKQWIKWASLNPMGMVLSNDVYPDYKPDQTNDKKFDDLAASYDKNEQVIKEVRAYLTAIKAKATEKIEKKGESGHHKHDKH